MPDEVLRSAILDLANFAIEQGEKRAEEFNRLMTFITDLVQAEMAYGSPNRERNERIAKESGETLADIKCFAEVLNEKLDAIDLALDEGR